MRAPRAVGPDGVEPVLLASIGQRAVALVIDSFLVALVVLPFAYRTFTRILEDPQGELVPLWLTALAAGTALGYNWAMVAWRGQTVGKMIMRVKVVTVEAGAVGFQAAGIRALVPTAVQLIPWGLGGILLIVVYGWAIFDPNRQGLHDKAAGTLVVHAPRTTQ